MSSHRKSKQRKARPVILALLLCLFLVGLSLETGFGFWSKLSTSIKSLWLIPGFEGAKCQLVGARPIGCPTDWTGYAQYNAGPNPGGVICSHDTGFAADKVFWMNSDPFNTLVAWDYQQGVNLDRLKMLVETQQMVSLENLNYMGDPLDWNKTQQLEVIQYEPNQDRQLTKTVAGEETYYTLTKRGILLVPAEVHVSLSIPAANDHSTHWSGWQEGDWFEMELWFQLDFTTWNTLSQSYAETDTMPEWDASYFATNPANEYNKYSTANVKGGFPIAGWVQGYLENVGPDWPEDYDDEIWGIFKSDTGKNTQITEASKSTLNAKTQTLPELTGRALPLFSNPADPMEAYTGGYTGFVNILEQARIYPWIPGQSPAYFVITVSSLGTVAESVSPFVWDLYYPAVNYRLRVIYAVYGEFTYLWTVKTAEDNGYPGWETRQYEWVHVEPGWSWFYDLISNPVFLFFLFLFIVLIIVVILAATGVLGTIGALGGASKGQRYKPSKRPPPEEPDLYY